MPGAVSPAWPRDIPQRWWRSDDSERSRTPPPIVGPHQACLHLFMSDLRKWIRTVVGGTVVGLALVLATVTPALASSFGEFDDAVPGSPPAGLICKSVGASQGCFKKYGDNWWVKSGNPDDFVRVEWRNQLWNPNYNPGVGAWDDYRSGYCEAFDIGVGSWGVCAKDYYENSSVNYFSGRGSRVIWRICEYYSDTCSTWSLWTLNDA